MNRVSCFVLMTTAVILGILSGIAQAFLWVDNLIPFVRQMAPYAAADALLIFGITAIIALFYRSPGRAGEECPQKCPFLGCLVSFVKTIMISSAVFLVFVQVMVGTAFPFVVKAILAFIGSISFWIMLLTFIALVIWIARKR